MAKFEKKNNINYLILRIGEQTKSSGIVKRKVGEKMKKEKFQRKAQVVLVHGKREKCFDKIQSQAYKKITKRMVRK